MIFIEKLSKGSNKRKSKKNFLIFWIVGILSCSLFLGLFLTQSLSNGLKLMEARLGADIFAVPYSATTMQSFDGLTLTGETGKYYMTQDLAKLITERSGVDKSTPQLFLANLSLDDVSEEIPLIAIDSKTDFVVKPWVKEDSSSNLGKNEIYIGANLQNIIKNNLTIYDTPLKVVGTLAESETFMDNSIYIDMETVQTLISSGANDFPDSDKFVSSLLINVRGGYTVNEVLDDINVHVRGVEAMRMNEMITDANDKLFGVSSAIKTAVYLVWGLLLLLLFMTLSMICNEHKRDLAILAVLGASKNKIQTILLRESFQVALIGGGIGIVVATILTFPCSIVLSQQLDFPLLSLKIWQICLLAVISLTAILALTGGTTFFLTRKFLSKPPAIMLRGEK